MARSAEDVFLERIMEREERECQKKLEQLTREKEQHEQVQLRIQELLPDLAETAQKTLKRLRKAGWPDWHGGELRRVRNRAGDAEQRAVWRAASIGESYTFLGSNGFIYGGTPHVDEALVEFEWQSPAEIERVIVKLKKIQE